MCCFATCMFFFLISVKNTKYPLLVNNEIECRSKCPPFLHWLPFCTTNNDQTERMVILHLFLFRVIHSNKHWLLLSFSLLTTLGAVAYWLKWTEPWSHWINSKEHCCLETCSDWLSWAVAQGQWFYSNKVPPLSVSLAFLHIYWNIDEAYNVFSNTD